ncbi:MAG: diguanylate cyclase [Lachnospiraceae bacterium]|nr:diguanylate cyclase [Lachnospiraceae bacterium]
MKENGTKQVRKYKTKKQSEIAELIANASKDYSGTMKMAKKMLRDSKNANNPYVVGALNYLMGVIEFRTGSRINVLDYAMKATAVLENTTDYEMIVRSNNLLGIAYSAMEEYQLALTAYNAAHVLVKKHRIKIYKNIIANNIIETYYQLGDVGRAAKQAEKTLKDIYVDEPDNYGLIAVLYINLSEFYQELGRFDKALNALKEVHKCLKHDQNMIDLCNYHSRCASLAYAMGDVRKGNECSDKMVDLINHGTDSYELHKDYEKIAIAQIQVGEYDRADVIAGFLWKYAEKTQMSLDRIIASRVQAAYYDKTGDDLRALKHYRILNECYIERELSLKNSQLIVEKKTEALNKEMRAFIRELQKRERLLEREPLTKLLNRNALSKVMNEYVDEAKEKGKKVGAIFIDVDYFKQYNDTYGHAKGDECLKAVAAVCAKEETNNVKFARYGGDEFFGIMIGYSDEKVIDMAKRIARSIKNLAMPHAGNPNDKKVTLSIGLINMYIGSDKNLIDIVNYSDKALYHSKEKGKNCVYMFDDVKHDRRRNEEEYVEIKFK